MSKPLLLRELEPLERRASKRGQKKLRLSADEVARERLLLLHDDGTFGTALVRVALCKTQSLDQALQEVCRVLRPGGRVAGAVWTRQGRDYASNLFYFANKEYSAAIRHGFKVLESKAVFRRPPDMQLLVFLLEKQ